jgi:hypothetical protein
MSEDVHIFKQARAFTETLYSMIQLREISSIRVYDNSFILSSNSWWVKLLNG